MKKLFAYALAAVIALSTIAISVAAEDQITDPDVLEDQYGLLASSEFVDDAWAIDGTASRAALKLFLAKMLADFNDREGGDETTPGTLVTIGTKTGEVLEDTIDFGDTPIPKAAISKWSLSASSSSPLFKKASLEKGKDGEITGILVEFREDRSTNTDDKDIKVTLRFTKGTEYVNETFEWTYSTDVRGYDDGDDISVDNGAIYEYTSGDVSGSATFFFTSNIRYDARIARTQAPVNLTFETGAVDVVEDEYNNVDFSFFRVLGTNSFRTEGKLVIKADEGDYIYGIEGNRLVALNNWTYNKNEGAIILTTNRLGAYALANANLKLTAPGTTTTNPAKNPGTGSDRGINGAVLFAIISLAATSAAAFRKIAK